MIPNFIITDTLTESQIDQLVTLYHNESWSNQRDRAGVKVMLQNSRIIALIDPGNNEIIGFTRFLTDMIYRATIYDVIVSQPYRGQGYGRALLENLINHPILKTVERVDLYCNDTKVPFYEKFGFKKVPQETNFMRRMAV